MSEENQNAPASPTPPAQQSHTSGLAIAGLVIGVIALLGCWVPLLNVGSAFIALIGLVLSIIGVVKARKAASGKAIAVAATALNAVALVAVIGMYGTAGAAYDAATSDSSSSSAAVSESDASKTADSQDAAGGDASESATSDTAAKFKQIKHGMSYKQVKKIMGSEGDEQASSSVADNEATVYQWTTDDFGVVSVTFENDKVVNKAQISLDGTSGPKATKAKYKKVKNGMTVKQVEKIFGGEGSLTSDTNIAGYSSQIYTWYGDSLGSNCTITFSDGEVTSKSQIGLK